MTASKHPAAREPHVTYDSTVRDFDHGQLASMPAYATLRQALSDLGNELAGVGGMELGDWLAAVRDMTATAHCGDMCNQCNQACQGHDREPDAFPRPCGAYRMWWPNAVKRTGNTIRGRYRCGNGHEWGCSWPVAPLRLG